MWDGKRELTAEEKSIPYSKFYDHEIVKPDPKKLAKMTNGPIGISKILPINKINDLLNEGYLEEEAGWCQLPDGTAYVAAHCHMPGVTKDMIDWWFAWHGLEDLRYMLWWPSQHYGIYVSEEEKKIIKDPAAIMRKKFQGITHYVVEDIGTGVTEIKIMFQPPENLGFDMERFHEPNVATVIGANVLIYDPGKSMGVPSGCNVMCHFVREVEDGIELRTRFWFGYQMFNGKPVKILPDGVIIPESVPAGLAVHAVEEYTQLAHILPEIYAEFGHLPF